MKALGLALLLSLSASGYLVMVRHADPTPAGDKTSLMVETAANVLASLSPEQREAALFPFDTLERKHWNYTPYPHAGVDWRDLREAQRGMIADLLRTVLSEQGYAKTRAIMELEDILRELEDRPAGDERRNPERYYFSLFGEPSESDPWGWRFEGHHVSLNFSSVGNDLAVTPSFFGTNPHAIPIGPRKGHRILDKEEDLVLDLMAGLNEQQRQVAVIAEEAPADMLTANHPAVDLTGYQGLAYPAMDDEQQEAVREIIQLYLNNMKPEIARTYWDRIRNAGLENIHFAWAGPLSPGHGQYYRLHGPTLLIEYDNTQNEANHVHSVLRDPTNDWGEDLLRAHYEREDHRH